MTPQFCFLDLRGETVRSVNAPRIPLCLALGSFDGVHSGHRQLLAEAHRMAMHMRTEGRDAVSGVFSFFRPSRHALGLSSGQGEHLTTLREKLYLWKSEGIEMACLCDLSRIRDLSPQAFLTLLHEQVHAVGLVCGENFRFGCGGVGRSTDIEAFASRVGNCQTAIIPTLEAEGEPVSSTRIRHLLTEGRMAEANRLLQTPYALEATVVPGKRLGRTLGFPTANLRFPAEKLAPAHGVYVSLCHTPFGVYYGVSNVGVRPTVEQDGRINCETYMMGLDADLYGRRIRVEFLQYLRPEVRFDSVEALTHAIRQDTEAATAFMNTYPATR